jgi:hypothetical protein
MQDKQKVTLYLPPELHRKLKIRAAVDSEPMSTLAERALSFYLLHSDVVEQTEAYGSTHRIHSCPSCDSSLVLRDEQLVELGAQSSVLLDDDQSFRVESMPLQDAGEGAPEGELAELVPC